MNKAEFHQKQLLTQEFFYTIIQFPVDLRNARSTKSLNTESLQHFLDLPRGYALKIGFANKAQHSLLNATVSLEYYGVEAFLAKLGLLQY